MVVTLWLLIERHCQGDKKHKRTVLLRGSPKQLLLKNRGEAKKNHACQRHLCLRNFFLNIFVMYEMSLLNVKLPFRRVALSGASTLNPTVESWYTVRVQQCEEKA